MKNKTTNSTLSVKDLSVASFLMASEEVKLAHIERSLNRTVYFCFEPKEKAEKLVFAYWADTALSIQPKQLFQSLHSLKNLIFSES